MDVEAVFVGEEMYLRDKATNYVYKDLSSTGPEHVLGHYHPNKGQVVLFQHRQQNPNIMEFQCDSNDHCETDAVSYEDIAWLLRAVSKALSTDPLDLAIYDPYFCNGAIHHSLGLLSFLNIFNSCENCYDRMEKEGPPACQVVVTNPPYSEPHLERCFTIFGNLDLPFFCLVPAFTLFKPFFQKHLHNALYILPKKRYTYHTPKWISRSNPKARKDGRTSPFISLWIILHLPKKIDIPMGWQTQKGRAFLVTDSIADLPKGVLGKHASTVKKRKSQRNQPYRKR